MDIQRILFPRADRCMEKELYYRSDTIHETDCRELCFENQQTAAFDTYFNGFSMEKWKKYTKLESVSIRLVLSGKFKVTLIAREKTACDIHTTVVSESIVESAQARAFIFPFENVKEQRMYAFEVTALRERSTLFGGAYMTNIGEEQIQPVKIGLGICTYKREAFIEKNIAVLKEEILENKESPLYGKLEVFIADNGQTLEREKLESAQVRVYPNLNYGGSGGFTRTLIEMMAEKEALQITHVLLMDDDVMIEPEALVRTYMVLALRRDEYREAFVGGAMLRLDQPALQVEAGAVWNGGYMKSLKSNLDLRRLDACLENEIEEYAEYNAWWYCCFPMDVVTSENLPLPLFIRADDVEYGLRNMRRLILMNGICVWHEAFENKSVSDYEYYIIRNQLICNSFHCRWYGVRCVSTVIMKHTIKEVWFCRYKHAALFLDGVKDYLKGPQWLMRQDSEQIHKAVMAAGYRGQQVPGEAWSFTKSVKYLARGAILAVRIPFCLKKKQREWRTEGLELRTLTFWNDFLKLNEDTK